MSKIKAVIFDQGGVLSRGGGAGTNERMSAAYMDLDKIELPKSVMDDLKLGRINNERYVKTVNELYPDAPKKLEMEVWDQIFATLVSDEAAYALVARCVANGLKVGLLSNINPTVAQLLSDSGAYEPFEPVIVLSCVLGAAKPQPEVYAEVERLLPGIKPEEILFLDDQDKCLKPARERGWKTILVTSSEQMLRDTSEVLGF